MEYSTGFLYEQVRGAINHEPFFSINRLVPAHPPALRASAGSSGDLIMED